MTSKTQISLEVRAALSEDINSGWIWLPDCVTEERTVVKVKCRETGKKIVCEALPIGQNFRDRYNDQHRTIKLRSDKSYIVANEWYRKRLGILETQCTRDFVISVRDGAIGRITASYQHPQVVVRVAMGLGILSFLLAILSLILTFQN